MPSTAGPSGGYPTAPRLPWWMLLVAAAFAGYFILLVHSDLTRPGSAGFVADIADGVMTVRAVSPDSSAARAGMRPGDQVSAVDDVPIRTRLDWLSVEANLRPDHPFLFDLVRDGEHRSASVTLSRAPRRFWRSAAAITLIAARVVQLITLVLAFVVAFKKPFESSARAGAWLLATLGVYSVVWPYQIAATWRGLPVAAGLLLWLPFLSSLAAPAVLITFFAMFPRPVIRSWHVWLLAWVPMVPLLWLQAGFFGRVVYRPELAGGAIDWTRSAAFLTTGYTVAALWILVAGYRQLADVTERRRIRILVFGSVVGLVSVLAVVWLYWIPSAVQLRESVFTSPFAAVGALFGLAAPLAFTYAILRHRLFGIGYIVRRGLQYALARRGLISIVPSLVAIFGIDLWIHRTVPVADIVTARGSVYAALAALALVAWSQRDRWLEKLDRRFFRERYAAERLLRDVSASVRTATDVEAAASQVAREIDAALHPQGVAILARTRQDQVYRVIARLPPTAAVEPISGQSKILGLLEWLQKPLALTDVNRAGFLAGFPQEDLDWLSRSRVELLVPLRAARAGGIRGVIALGAKRSEEPFSPQDTDLLMAIADSVGILLGRESPASTDLMEECPQCGACYDFGTTYCEREGARLSTVPLPRLLADRYRLDRRVGRGGMGVVYAAFDTLLERLVAAKVLRDDSVRGPQDADRLKAEARLAASLHHPNVVTIHDTGVTRSDRVFFIMELMEGSTLREELNRVRRLPVSRVLHIMRGVCAAVDVAHQHNLIHRDLKPENIFLCERSPLSGEPEADGADIPKVMDFGVAKTLDRSLMLTEPGHVAGTPQYMSPEHARGGEPSPDWDLWALAVMTFEMITGGLPKEGSTALPDSAQQFFARALAPDPTDRPTSASELFAELEHAIRSTE